MNNILFTDVQTDDGECNNVMVQTNLPFETVRDGFSQTSLKFDDCYPVKDRECQYYIYESLLLDAEGEAKLQRLAFKFRDTNRAASSR